jgi:hypothetical protein
MNGFSFEVGLFLLEVLEGWTYPALYSLSLVLFLIAIFTLSADSKVLLAKLTEFIPPGRLRTPGGIVLLSVMLVMPLASGVLMSLVLWGIVIFMFLRHRKYLGLGIGLLMLGWGTMIPLREQAANWRADNELQFLMQSYRETVSPTEGRRFQWLLDQRSKDPLVVQAYARFLRETGDYDKALSVLSTASESLGKAGWIYAEMGLASYLKRDFKESEYFYKKAQESGFKSAALYYNWSLLKFAVMDLAGSSAMYEKALTRDRSATLKFFEQEAFHGAVYADFVPGASSVLLSALIPGEEMKQVAKEFAWQLTPLGKNLSYWCFSFTGIIYSLAFLALIRYPERGTNPLVKSDSIFTRLGHVAILMLFWGAGSLWGLNFTLTYFS